MRTTQETMVPLLLSERVELMVPVMATPHPQALAAIWVADDALYLILVVEPETLVPTGRTVR